MVNRITFFRAQTANGSSDPQIIDFPDTRGEFKIWGVWDGAEVVMETQTPADFGPVEWLTVNDVSRNPVVFTENESINVRDFVFGEKIRLTLTNAGANTEINATLENV